MKTFLQVNKYDDPRFAMELIGHICTADKDIDYTNEFNDILSLLFEMEDEKEEKDFAWNDDLSSKIEDILKILEKTYIDNTYQLKIAVAGGYSAGKSTFMNMLIGKKEFLPTDMNPTSLVNTYLNFNNKITKSVVRGENIKNNLVLLDEDVLASIRHDTKNAKAIANVLRRLIIDVPCTNYLDGITFIDTPGYDNAISVNRENGTTDKETAGKAFKDANIIFWCANIGKQVTVEDLNFIKENGGEDKPVVILLSRMKGKPQSEVSNIAKSCLNTASGIINNVVDVIAFDRDVPLEGIYSCMGNSLTSLFAKIKNENRESVFDLCKFTISSYFEEEMDKSKTYLKDCETEYQETVKNLNITRKRNSNQKSENKDWINDLRKIIIDSYNEVLNAASNCAQSSSYAIAAFERFIDGVDDFENNDHFGTSSMLDRYRHKAYSEFQSACNKHNAAIKYQYYKEEWRKDILSHFDFVIEKLSEKDTYGIDYYENVKKDLSEDISSEKRCQQCIEKYQPKFLSLLSSLNQACLAKRNKHYQTLEKLDNTKETDIFSAISGGDMSRFILCLHSGVELSTCNSQGYNVLTWIVYNDNHAMLDIILKHKDDKEGIDLSITDKNGYNILDLAAIAHNKLIYSMIKKQVSSIILRNEKAISLSKQNDFGKWLSNNI